ncbi:MAG: bifunctional riboflavin kinase/FAD synthetase [Thermodesulfobacteriota bacterium]|nr:bifunctional riboflavin kinase/FAD synthetase [Thermodesulfobacteriota bacterium]
MQLIEGLENIPAPFDNAVVTIGNFDGVHKGHQALFQRVRERAAELNGTSVVITFEPHPARVLNPEGMTPLITIYEQKVELIEQAGVDVLICIRFTREFASVTATAFVEDILVKQIGVRSMVIGNDYAFGKNREGDMAFLKSCGREMGFDVISVDWVDWPGRRPEASDRKKRISSTAIRELVHAGRIREAADLLGRHYQVRGTVVSGRGRGGASLGFPTANIELTDELCPADGVYAVLVTYASRQYKGVANIGYSPTFDDHIFTVEVHILDFCDQINGERINVAFVKRIRDEKKFDGIESLKIQIQKDIDQARQIFSQVC